jgi:hypothetical protein
MTFTATPTSPPGCASVVNYAYPNPDPGNTLNFLYVLCETSRVQIQVFNAGGAPVAKWDLTGDAGNNLYPADVSKFSHGIYYYYVSAQGVSGPKRSQLNKFCLTRSP